MINLHESILVVLEVVYDLPVTNVKNRAFRAIIGLTLTG